MKIFRPVLMVALALTITSCASVSVVVDQNKNIDWSKYKTYSFLGWQNHSDQDLSAEDKGYLRDAFTKEFERRGLTRVNSGGDMQISLYIVLSVETAISGYEAGVKTVSFRPHVLILDHLLGDTTSREVSRSLRANEELQDLKIIVMSGYLTDDEVDGMLMNGVQDFIRKPFDLKEVKEKIFKVLNLA